MRTYGAIHHLDLNVADLEGSARFYGAILTCIGYRRANLSAPGEPEGFDWMAPDARGGHRFSIGLYPARRNRPHDRYAPGIHHLALRAKSREDVDELYRVLLKIKAEILEAPREYPEYEPGYYALFFLDPDGIKLEFVFTNDRD
jgi:glyoxylase I family protein